MLQKIALILIPLNVFFDVSLVFFEKGGVVPLIRAGFLLTILIAVFFKFYSRSRHYKILLLFTLYVLINVAFSSDVSESFKISIKILSSMLGYIVGFNLINTISLIKLLNKSIVVVYVILLLNYIISSLFGLGVSVYTGGDDFLMGNLSDNWNLFVYPILLAPLLIHFYKENRMKKMQVFILAFISGVVVLLSLKRIAIMGLFVGNSINAFFSGRLTRVLKPIILVVLTGIISFPIYSDLLMKRIDSRSQRFEKGSLEKENRYLETFYVWEETLSFKNIPKSLFGLEGFNSVRNYANGRFGDRQLHVDYNLIVNTIGLIGLLTYFLIFSEIYRTFIHFYRRVKGFSSELNKILKGTFFTLLLTPFLTSFAGQMYAISFRLIIFIYLGSIVGIYFRQYSHESSDRMLTQ